MQLGLYEVSKDFEDCGPKYLGASFLGSKKWVRTVQLLRKLWNMKKTLEYEQINTL